MPIAFRERRVYQKLESDLFSYLFIYLAIKFNYVQILAFYILIYFKLKLSRACLCLIKFQVLIRAKSTHTHTHIYFLSCTQTFYLYYLIGPLLVRVGDFTFSSQSFFFLHSWHSRYHCYLILLSTVMWHSFLQLLPSAICTENRTAFPHVGIRPFDRFPSSYFYRSMQDYSSEIHLLLQNWGGAFSLHASCEQDLFIHKPMFFYQQVL